MNRDNFLSTDFGLNEFNVKSKKERVRRYRRYVYEAGAINRPDKMQAKVIDDKVVAKERKKEFEINRINCFRYPFHEKSYNLICHKLPMARSNPKYFRLKIDGFVKSLKIAILSISHLINSVSYKVDFGIF